MMTLPRKKVLLSAGLCLTILAGCAADDPHRRAKTGAAIGAVVGAVVGHQVDDDKGRYIGAVVGAIAGGAVGNYMDQQQRKLEALLQDEQATGQLAIRRLSDDSVLIGVASEASFDVGKADIKPNAIPIYGKIADVLKQYDKTAIHVIGHTDSTGAEDFNQRLSEQRAGTVANYFRSTGIVSERLFIEGRGESEPRATNDTAEGRAKNRRVDIIVKAIVEGQEGAATLAPRAYRY